MRNLIAVFIMAFYTLGNVLFPNVDSAHLYEMYQHCEGEDPDISVADFVFEHLLNIPDIFEGEEEGEHEEQHQPSHVVNSSQIAVVLGKPISFECKSTILHNPAIIYGTFRDQHFPAGFSSEMLRPPTV